MQECDKHVVGHLEEALAVALTPVAFLGSHKRHLCKLVAKHPATNQKLVKTRSAQTNTAGISANLLPNILAQTTSLWKSGLYRIMAESARVYSAATTTP